MQEHHDTAGMGYPQRAKSLELLQRKYYWPRLRKDIMRYIRNCHTCQHSHTGGHAPHRVLRPQATPEKPWQDISMDFVKGLPSSEGYDAICVIVDHPTKQRHLLLCTTMIEVEEFVELFIREVFRLHSLPQTAIFNRGPQFIAAF